MIKLKPMIVACVCCVMAIAQEARAELKADQLLLVVNKNQPAGRELAEHYAKVREVPQGRIVEVDVPDQTVIGYDVYESRVSGVIREQMKVRGLNDKVKCLVTFYGMPLRVDPRADLTGGRELKEIEFLIQGVSRSTLEGVGELEKLTKSADPDFVASNEQGLQGAINRMQSAAAALQKAISARRDLQTNNQVLSEAQRIQAKLSRVPRMSMMPSTRPSVAPTQDQMTSLLKKSHDPAARKELREMAYFFASQPDFWRVLEEQKMRVGMGNPIASLDSELSLMLYPEYDRTLWQPNAMHFKQPAGTTSQQLMVSRIDAASAEVARRIIDESKRVEDAGLDGDIVIDARGVQTNDGYGAYDKSIRNFAAIASQSSANVIYDEKEALLPEGTSQKTMLYVGWYRLRNYLPTSKFVPGAIAVHIASEEMLQLRPADGGWCSGQLRDGADVTLGAVYEPFLSAFPLADEFFPLLMTGQYTLADCYWATVPLTSWRLTLIGDPLYRPFANNPVLTLQQLPAPLRKAID